jgi:hypothetical protein
MALEHRTAHRTHIYAHLHEPLRAHDRHYRMNRLWLGVATLLGGIAIWLTAKRATRDAARAGESVASPARPTMTPARLARLGGGLMALGVATMASAQRGVGWSISAICFALIAIILIGSVVVTSALRR